MTSVKNKYKKFLNEKEKLVSSTSIGQGAKNGDRNREQIKFLPFFNPRKMLNMKDEVVVRVLPNKEGFYHEYSKHMMNLGDGVFKQFVCLHSKNRNGAEYGRCPMCDFLEDNANELAKETYYRLMAKNTYMIFIYNAEANQIQKYECNDFGIVDITAALIKLIDENEDNFDPDAEGFGIIFRKDEKGYAKVVEAILPTINVADILKKVGENEIKDFYDEVMPFNMSYTVKKINETYAQVIKAYAPTFDYEQYLTTDDVNDEATQFKPEMFDEKVKKSKTTVEPDEEEEYTSSEIEENVTEKESDIEDDNSQISDIRDFLKSRKKK